MLILFQFHIKNILNICYGFSLGMGNPYDLPESRFKNKNSRLLQLEHFDNLLTIFIITSRFTNNNYYAGLKEKIDEILQAIEGEIK